MTDVVERDLADLASLEASDRPTHLDRADRDGARGARPRRFWLLAVTAAVFWAFWDAGPGRGRVLNTGGWTVANRFVSAMWKPELSGDFLTLVGDAAVTTVAYALVGTAFALTIGLIGGVISSELLWERDRLDLRLRRIGPLHARRRRLRAGWFITRLVNVVPRGIHEAIWALFLLLVLGADPLVAVLAIGIPFGAITAKVVAELIDDAADAGYRSLRDAGARRLPALLYGVGPVIGAEIVSYGFYRLECSIRSSVVIGMIGAGGIGFQIAVSEDGLNYSELWTLIYVLIGLSALADWWGASLRRRPSRRRLRASVMFAVALTAGSAWYLKLQPWRLANAETRRELQRVATDAWPPKLPQGGWSDLVAGVVDTVQLSIIAIVIATAIAVPIAFLAARPHRRDSGRGARVGAGVARGVFLFCRAVPPPLWALLVLFLTYPGPLAGGIALGLYTLGVLGRLDAEVVENADQRPAEVLRHGGATAGAAFVYGTVPTVAPRFVAFSLYRWEVAIRETVIVGLVGAGGLGALLQQQRAAFDEARMLTTILALIGLAFAVDIASSRLRRVLR